MLRIPGGRDRTLHFNCYLTDSRSLNVWCHFRNVFFYFLFLKKAPTGEDPGPWSRRLLEMESQVWRRAGANLELVGARPCCKL